MIQNLTREKQRFANYLFLKCSGIAQDKAIPNTSATTIALMEHFETVDDLANAILEELTAFIIEAAVANCRPGCHRQGGTGCGQRLLPAAKDGK